MKKWPKLILYSLLTLIAYLTSLAVFISLATTPHITLAVEDQRELASQLIAEYPISEDYEIQLAANTKVIIYDSDGSIVFEKFHKYSPILYRCEAATEAYMTSDMLSPENTVLIIEESQTGSLSDRIDLVSYYAEAVITDGKVVGIIVILKDLVSDVFFISSSFFAFTLVYIAFLIGGIFLLHKQRAMNRFRQNYIDNITHELKTPITTIKALISTLNDHDTDQKTRSEYYGLIMMEASRQEHMVQNILELSRIQGKRVSFKKSAVAADELFRPICERYASLCDDLDIEWNVSEKLKSIPTLHTNAECIQKILDILLGNSLRFTSERGKIWLDAEEHSSHITVCVRDNGTGITKAELPYVFDRFYRGENSYPKGGNGLGLAIAKELINGLGEKIGVESEAGYGSTFYFTISKK